MSLFAQSYDQPLAKRMRPTNLDEFVGQQAIVGQGRYLKKMIELDKIPSIIFFGPPGTGKTTLAKIIANSTGYLFEQVNAVSSGASDLRKVIELARQKRLATGIGTILFVDEIHRFNKAQQDILLPYVENGIITLIGATTENPFFEVNSPLLSRMKIIRLEALLPDDIKKIVQNALLDEQKGYGAEKISIDDEALDTLVHIASGDARRALNLLEQLVSLLPEDKKNIDKENVLSILSENQVRYDKGGDAHYDVTSAFIKSMRGSDADGALYYLAKMIEGGEDLKFIARRIVICAAEDVGNADPQALVVAMAAAQAAQFVGFPEAKIPLAQAVTYIATAPKSNSAYVGIGEAIFDVKNNGSLTVPVHLRDAHYKGAKAFGHGKDYLYPHDYDGNYVKQDYLPKELSGKEYYKPTDNGYEKIISQRMASLKDRGAK